MATLINVEKKSRLYHQMEQPDYQQDNTLLVTAFVDQLIADAINRHASDIHFEPQRNKMRIRFRIDSVLHTICQPYYLTNTAISNHLKIRANLDIAEKRLPQDGRFAIEADKHQPSARVSTLPTLFGEKIVLRLLYKNQKPLDIQQLGLEQDQISAIMEAINKPQGLILITGPTGSGKTTTLYTLLHQLNHGKKNISCIEDPIEIELAGSNQLNIHPEIGLGFQSALKSLLRQDPDIIVVGEIRDAETAKMVIQAAQTGHLVFSTLHTNGATESLHRLASMGLSQFELEESLILIVAQRLLRKLCPDCKIPVDNDFKAGGCKKCYEGYRGQSGIYEYLDVNKQQISVSGNSLQASAKLKVIRGITSNTEVKRVLG